MRNWECRANDHADRGWVSTRRYLVRFQFGELYELLFVCWGLSGFLYGVSWVNKQKVITSALGDCFGEVITLLQDSRSLILSPLVESNRKPIHFCFQVIEGKVDGRKWSHRDGCSFCHNVRKNQCVGERRRLTFCFCLHARASRCFNRDHAK